MNNGFHGEEEVQLEAAKRMLLSKILDKGAMERLGRVRMANPMLAGQLELYLLQLSQAGQLKETITDEKLRQILDSLVKKRETKIIRR